MAETKRVNFRDITFKGKEYRIKKMDARQGLYTAFQCKPLIPLAMSFLGKEKVDDGEKLINLLQVNMSRHDFYQLQNDCLSVCFHIVPAGEQSVMTPSGDFLDPDLSEDVQTVTALVLNSLLFNVQGFFGGNFLKELQSTFPNMSQSDVKTSQSI